MNNILHDPLAGLSVRLSTSEGFVGSGFVVSVSASDCLYVLTARHCVEKIQVDQILFVDFYNYTKREFFQSINVDKCYFFQTDAKEKYDIAVLTIPKQAAPVNILDCRLVTPILKQQSCLFRGFPNGLSGTKPKEIKAESSFSSGATTELNVIVRPEDNETSALANTQGFSGSGLIHEVEGQLTLLGIVTHYDPIFNTFTVYNLSKINELLIQNGQVTLDIEQADIRAKEKILEPSFIAQNQVSLREAETLWKDLKPQQALLLIESVRSNIEDSTLPILHRNPLLAKVYYLKALAEGDLELSNDTSALFIQAYNLHKEKREYCERAAAAYYQKENLTQAYQVVQNLLEEDEENARAWTIMTQLKPELSIPNSVKASPVFKVGQVAHLAKENRGVTTHDLVTIFSEELRDLPALTFLDRSNLYYWDYVAQTAMHHAFQQSGQFISFEKPYELKNDSLLKYACNLFAHISQRVEGTDFQEQNTFRVARFDYCYCQYFLTDDSIKEKQLIGDLYQLFIGEETLPSLPFLKKRLSVAKSIPTRLLDVLALFLQQQNPQLVINAVAAVPESELLEVQMMVGHAYAMLEQSEDMIQAYSRYIHKVNEIDQYVAANCLVIIRNLFVAGHDIDVTVGWLTDGKIFTHDYIKELLKAFCWSQVNTKITIVKESADIVKLHWNYLEQPLRKALATVYSDLKEWDTAKALWQEIIGDGLQESEELMVYLLVLFAEHKDFDELFFRLAYWREHFKPNLLITSREIQLYRRLNKYDKQAEVAAYGMDYFPEEIQFWLDRVEALHHLGDIEALSPLLDQRLLTANLPSRVRLSAAHIYLIHGKSTLGQEACYRVLKENWSNPAIKIAYFSLSTQYKGVYDTDFPETAQAGMVVRFSVEGKQRLIELTSEELEHNSIAKKFIGLHINDSFQHIKSVTGQQITYNVVQIFDKYQGQQALIAEEIGDKPHDMPVQVFEIPAGEGPQRLLAQMKEIFGPQEIKRQLLFDEAEKDFYSYKIGFLELTHQAFNDSPVGTWEYITSDFKKGFPIFPLVLQAQRQPPAVLDEGTEFVLEFSSLLTVHRLSDNKSLLFQGKRFVVSQYTIDFVNLELEQALNGQISQMSLGFRADQFIPYFHPDDLQERRIKFWSNLQNWIQENCRPDYAPERLTWEWENKEEDFDLIFSDKKLYSSSFWDSMLLANRPNRLLISDDLFLFTKLPNKFLSPITTEWFLRKAHSARYQSHYWLELVQLNMRGLTLTGSQLYQTFHDNKLVTGPVNDYFRAIHSFAVYHNPNRNNLFEVIIFLKKLYADNLLLDYKRRTSRALLQVVMNGLNPVPESMVKQLVDYINSEFKLLGSYGLMVKEDLQHSLEVLAQVND